MIYWGFVTLSKNVGKPNVGVTFIDDSSDAVLTITQLKDLGKEYLLYCGENYIRCERCNTPIKQSRNGKAKYCNKCAEIIDREKAQKRMRDMRK